MDKIRDLMVKCGLKTEVAAHLCESIQTYVSQREAELQAQYESKIEEGKKICLEEVDSHKRELARRLQIFCESKSTAIELQVARQAAIKESAATARLRSIQTLLVGVQPNEGGDGKVRDENDKLKNQIKELAESKGKAIAEANRANALAEKVLKRNRNLESILNEGRRRQSTGKAVVSEERTQRPAVKAAPVRARSAQPQTTRATLAESQARTPAAQVSRDTGLTPTSIASMIE
jgi:hypothetical protein